MEKMAFVSRHTPTARQHEIAAEAGYELIAIGDYDAFSVCPADISAHGDFAAVCVVHPAAALRLINEYDIGVFENSARPVEGGRPQFEASALYIYKTFFVVSE